MALKSGLCLRDAVYAYATKGQGLLSLLKRRSERLEAWVVTRSVLQVGGEEIQCWHQLAGCDTEFIYISLSYRHFNQEYGRKSRKDRDPRPRRWPLHLTRFI